MKTPAPRKRTRRRRGAAQTEADAKRFVGRDGDVNYVVVGESNDFFRDLYHFLLVSSWPRLLGLLAAAYAGANCLFAIAYILQSGSIENAQAGSFLDAFFFSVQTMATVGYGKMVPGTLYAEVLAASESFVGLLGLAVVTGLVFAKFSRPTARVLFSRVAVVTSRDGVPCLVFRLANQRQNQIVEAQMHVVLARNETTAEGESLRRLTDLKMVRSRHALFVLSWTAIHEIVPGSPLYGETEESLRAAEAEIIVSVTGLDDVLSQNVHARHSYVVDEIVWGARFVDILFRLPDGRRAVDYAHFHDVERN